jgi:hypothetical protein
MKRTAVVLLTLALMLVSFGPYQGHSAAQAAAPAYSGFPSFSIVSVVKDTSVKIKTYNLPPNDTFVVKMNYMGTRGVHGIEVATLNSGAGGVQTLEYSIPAALLGEYQIAIRLQSTSGSGYYAYNWFYNNTAAKPGSPGPTSSPTMKILAVQRNVNVTVRIYNLPANDEFKVLMNYMGTRGVGGYKVISLDTLSGGTQDHTFSIPAELAGLRQIAIRIQSKTGSGYYAYNWFYNNTTP